MFDRYSGNESHEIEPTAFDELIKRCIVYIKKTIRKNHYDEVIIIQVYIRFNGRVLRI